MSNGDGREVRIEKDARYPDGRARSRYHGGQGRRGAPDAARVGVVDLTHAIEAFTRARAALAQAAELRGDKRARAAAIDVAREQISMGLRFAKGAAPQGRTRKRRKRAAAAAQVVDPRQMGLGHPARVLGES